MHVAPARLLLFLSLVMIASLWLNACGSGSNSQSSSLASAKWTKITEQTGCEAMDPSIVPGCTASQLIARAIM
jgi:hypothetical protein